MTFQETTKPLMRPRQVEETMEEARRIEATLAAPPHIANAIQDRGEMTRQLRSLKASLEHQVPRPYGQDELDAAVQRRDDLVEQFTQGMPTQAEMRRNPSGARDKHIRWEKANKKKILEFKNIALRLHATEGGSPDETDIANIEKFRPKDAAHELNMHNEQIAGKMQYGPEPGAGPAVVFTDEETETLKAADPELASRLALMPNEHRQMVKDFIANLSEPGNPQPKRKRREYTPEERKAIGERLKAAREAKKQEG